MVKAKENCQTVIYLLYSTEEHTYADDVVPLLQILNEYNIIYKEQIETFTSHSMVDRYMSGFCKRHFR